MRPTYSPITPRAISWIPPSSRIATVIDLSELVEEPVEPRGRRQLERGLARAVLAHGVHHLGALTPAGDHVRDQLGGVLQVCVEHHHHVAARVLEPRGQRGLMAEVA